MTSNSPSKPSPVLFLCLLALLGYFGINVIQTMTDGYSYQDRVETLEQQVKNLNKKKTELSQELEVVKSNHFIESEARNKLHLAKENETIVVFPQKSEVLSETSQAETSVKGGIQFSLGYTNEWLKLFFN